MTPLLEVDHLSIYFRDQVVVRDLSFSVRQGEVLGLVGESGSGKSLTSLSILRLLDGAARVEGAIRFQGENLLALRPEQMRHYRGSKIAMIFQEPMTALNPVMRVGRQIAEAKAAKLGVKLIFPIFFCILPSLFVVTVGPVAVKIMRELIPMMNSI